MIDVYTFCDNRAMDDMANRLKWAREKAGIESARQAALRKLKMAASTYAAHENGQNEFGPDEARRYGRAFGVSPSWLLTGEGAPNQDALPVPDDGQVPIIGFVGAGATVHFFSERDQPSPVLGPEGATEDTAALLARDNGLGPDYNDWLVFYDRGANRVLPTALGRASVVNLTSGPILIRTIRRSRTRGLYHLTWQTEEAMLDIDVAWATPIRLMLGPK